jgi:hypothetical protein
MLINEMHKLELDYFCKYLTQYQKHLKANGNPRAILYNKP